MFLICVNRDMFGIVRSHAALRVVLCPQIVKPSIALAVINISKIEGRSWLGEYLRRTPQPCNSGIIGI